MYNGLLNTSIGDLSKYIPKGIILTLHLRIQNIKWVLVSLFLPSVVKFYIAYNKICILCTFTAHLWLLLLLLFVYACIYCRYNLRIIMMLLCSLLGHKDTRLLSGESQVTESEGNASVATVLERRVQGNKTIPAYSCEIIN